MPERSPKIPVHGKRKGSYIADVKPSADGWSAYSSADNYATFPSSGILQMDTVHSNVAAYYIYCTDEGAFAPPVRGTVIIVK